MHSSWVWMAVEFKYEFGFECGFEYEYDCWATPGCNVWWGGGHLDQTVPEAQTPGRHFLLQRQQQQDPGYRRPILPSNMSRPPCLTMYPSNDFLLTHPSWTPAGKRKSSPSTPVQLTTVVNVIRRSLAKISWINTIFYFHRYTLNCPSSFYVTSG